MTTDRMRELRTLSIDDAAITLRADDEDAAPVFVGTPIVYNSRTAIGNPLRWGFYEEIASGAATKTLSEGDARFLVDHDTGKPVSRVSAGTLRLAETKAGVGAESDLNLEKSYVNDLVLNLRDKTVTGMSFGFVVIKDNWDTIDVETNDGNTVQVELRTILEFQLLEVSAVTFPAYDDTEAGLRQACMAIRSAAGLPDLGARAGTARQPAESTDGSPTEAQPAETTGLRTAHLALRADALAALHRLPR